MQALCKLFCIYGIDVGVYKGNLCHTDATTLGRAFFVFYDTPSLPLAYVSNKTTPSTKVLLASLHSCQINYQCHALPVCFHLLPSFSLLTLLQPHWPLFCSLNMSNTHQLQDPRSCCSLCLEGCSSHTTWLLLPIIQFSTQTSS